ncbi:MAG TPA: hypothetical protein VMV09_05510 [Candidatus Saccharimonadales bacterium]|nr:hypothetical protein [Candidatus Saccharimonadales bacterium]
MQIFWSDYFGFGFFSATGTAKEDETTPNPLPQQVMALAGSGCAPSLPQGGREGPHLRPVVEVRHPNFLKTVERVGALIHLAARLRQFEHLLEYPE